MYSHYINKGKDLEDLYNLDPDSKSFYIASMLYEKEYKINILAEFLTQIAGGVADGQK